MNKLRHFPLNPLHPPTTRVEHLYRLMVENIVEGAVSLLCNGTILYSNAAFAEMVKMSLPEVTRLNFFDLLPKPFMMKCGRFITTERKWQGATSLKTRNGERIAVLISFHPLIGSHGSVYSAIVTDRTEEKMKSLALRAKLEEAERIVTERKRSEEDLLHYRAELEARVEERTEELRNLSRRLQFAREEERKRISREMHDEIGQMLTVLQMELPLIEKRILQNGGWLHREIGWIRDRVDETITAVRRLSSESRPMVLDDLGLAAAVEWQAAEFQKRTGIEVGLRLGAEEITTDPERATALFRILQESLTNVLRHAKASKVTVRLQSQDGAATLLIKDNGVGITRAQADDRASTGIIGMRERVAPFGGSLKVDGRPGKGTAVRVSIPLRDPA